MTDWVKTAERRPKHGQMVLFVCDNESYGSTARYYRIGQYTENSNCSPSFSWGDGLNVSQSTGVTWWAPFDLLPKLDAIRPVDMFWFASEARK